VIRCRYHVTILFDFALAAVSDRSTGWLLVAKLIDAGKTADVLAWAAAR
jgi:hypothetical protein